MAEYVSTWTYIEEQKTAAPNLEPSFEHLLRSSSVHESIITTLRVNEITDRDTFVNLLDSEATLNMSAADLGAILVGGGSPSQTRILPPGYGLDNSERDVRDKASNGCRRPCTRSTGDTTSGRLFQRMHGTHIHDDRLPAQTCY